MSIPNDQGEQAVILSGGGADGAYELGVMEALFSGQWQHGQAAAVEPSIFTGTSIGSFNAAFIVSESGPGNQPGCLDAVRNLRHVWVERMSAPEQSENGVFRLRGDPRTYLPGRNFNPVNAILRLTEDATYFGRQSLNRAPGFALSSSPLLQRVFEQIDLSSLLSTEQFQRLVSDVVVPERILADSARTLKIAATNWDTGQVFVFKNKSDEQRTGKDVSTKASYQTHQLTSANTTSAVLASAAIPGILPPVEIAGDNFVDGGLLMNTPLQPAIAANAQTLHVVYLDSKLERIPRGEVRGTSYTLNRTLSVTLEHIKEDLEYANLMSKLIATANSIERRADQSTADPATRWFVNNFAGMTELTVHRHYPSQSLGGINGMLDFGQQHVIDMMELGFDDTVRHDCRANGCILAHQIDFDA